MRRTLPIILGVAACLLTACGSGGAKYQAAQPPSVHIAALSGLPGALRIGLVYSLTGEGSDVAALATGAQVAAFQLQQSGDSVNVVPVNDQGSGTLGATDVQSLVAGTAQSRPVDAIIYASTGSHVLQAIQPALKAGIPVLLPYDSGLAQLPVGVWVTGPALNHEWSVLDHAMKKNYDGDMWRVTGSGATEGKSSLHFTRSLTLGNLAPALQSAVTNETLPPTVLVDAGARDSARITNLLETVGVLNIVVGPSATSPVFASALTSSIGQVGVTSVGIRQTDLSTTSGVSSFLEALRLLAVQSIQGSSEPACFAGNGAGTADFATHDAVLVLAKAAKNSGSTTGAALMQSIQGGLVVSKGDGLTGSVLKFSANGVSGPNDDVARIQPSIVPNSARQNASVNTCPGQTSTNTTYAVPPLDWFAPNAS